MNYNLTTNIKRIIPQPILDQLRWLKAIPARRVLARAPEMPAWLGWKELELLAQKYPFPPVYNYDPESLEQRGKERAGEILGLLRHPADGTNTFLELGCWDGMTSCALQRAGKSATAVDLRPWGFDPRAKRAGVAFLQMDATRLQFDDGRFDFVFSYNAFEHFDEPEQVLQEAIRVVRPGGYLYLNFGPLYNSPMGLHAYRSIAIPYLQFLFPPELLANYVEAQELKPIDFDLVNGWSLENFNQLWDRYAHQLQRTKYNEKLDVSHLDLIVKYPSCFKSKTQHFDSLIVSNIKVLFQRIQELLPNNNGRNRTQINTDERR